jgi:hypothetical protein
MYCDLVFSAFRPFHRQAKNAKRKGKATLGIGRRRNGKNGYATPPSKKPFIAPMPVIRAPHVITIIAVANDSKSFSVNETISQNTASVVKNAENTDTMGIICDAERPKTRAENAAR